MRKWMGVLVLAVLAVACAPAAAPTAAPTKTGAPAATATKPAAEPTKPVATTPTAAPQAAVKPLDPPVTVKIGGAGSLAEAFVYIADAKGYFAQEGLKPEFIRFNTAAQMIAPMGTGELDVGGGSPNPGLYNAIARGIPIKIVADRTSSQKGMSNMSMIVRKDLADSGQIKDYKDLKGKNITINATGTSTEILMEKALILGGLKTSDVNVVTMGFPDMAAALASKAVDVAICTDPTTAVAIQKGYAVKWKPEDEVYPNHQTSVLLYGPAFYQKQPEAAKRMMVAYERGIRDYLDAFLKNKNKAEIISILTKTTDAKEASLYDLMAVMGIDPNGYVDVPSLSADQDWYFDRKLMERKVDLKQVVDMQYVDYAVSRLGKY